MADPVGAALRIVDDVRDAVAPAVHWPATGRLHDPSLAGAERRAALGRQVLARIAALEPVALPTALAETLAIVRTRAQLWIVQPDWYWTAFDPGGGELFALFGPTPYGGGWVIGGAVNALSRAPLADDAGRARYLAGLNELGDVIDALAERTRGQAERGIHMPRAQAEAAVILLDRIAAGHAAAVTVGEERLAGHEGFRRETARVADARVGGGLRALRAVLDERYFGQVRDAVGLMHYPGGADIYAALVRHHGSTDLTPAEVHAVGLERMAGIRAGMAAAGRDASFDGDDHAYRAALDRDPAWRADTPQAIAAVFERYIERFRPRVPDYFNVLPRAGYGVRPLPDAMAGAMTFGYYRQPTEAEPRGEYVFNARNLAGTSLCTIASLTYHELVPGHHFHLAHQHEDLGLPAIRQWCMPTAYVEGWAEYAVTLAEEAGMFADPAERFGRYVNEAFLASRLVVDTGLNALGWNLAQARDYMRANSFFPETEIASETLRYGADIPAQALAYKLGDRALMAMREWMRMALGARFDIRDFHDTVLRAGAMPLPMLAERVERRTAELLA